MKKISFIAGAAIFVIVSFLAAYQYHDKPSAVPSDKKIVITTTLFPLYDMAKNIGQDKVEVSLLLPPGVEPHSFEPKPSDVVKINHSDLFIFTGKFMEPWAEDILKGTSAKNLTAIDSSSGITLLPGAFHDADEPAGSMDPHIWLDFDNDRKIVQTIAAALSEKDPADADYFQKQADSYKDRLSALDAEYEKTLSSCGSKEIIYGGHYAFGYLAHRYSLKYEAAQGLSPDSEPTANDLARLVDQIRKNGIRYIFYEELSSPKVAETIASETKAAMLPLDAAHNITKDDFANNISFFSIMEKNLANLSLGLNCKK